jgi:hypothetical protein
MIKKHFIVYTVLGAVSLGLIASLTYYSTNTISNANAQKQEVINSDKCGIRFSSGKNRMYSSSEVSGEGSAIIKTNYGNNITFAYNALSVDNETEFQTINRDGYLYNVEPIHGLHSINIQIKENTGGVLLSYGWQINNDNKYVYNNIKIKSSTIYEFSDEPNCIKLEYFNTPVSITSMNLNYSCIPSLNPFDGYDGLIYSYNWYNQTYAVIDRFYHKGDAEIVIPKYYDDGFNGIHPVTAIGSNALSYMRQVKRVIIPDSITSIGMYAFYNCPELTDIMIPSSVTEIGSGAFSKCYELRELIIPESVIYMGYGIVDHNRFTTLYAEATYLPETWSTMWDYGGESFFYSETEQVGYWRYVNGRPSKW